MFNTYIDTIKGDQDKGFVVFLGKPKTGSEPIHNRFTVFSNYTENRLKSVYQLDPNLLKDGLHVVINQAEYTLFKNEFYQAQKHLAYIYNKYIRFPGTSTTVGDPLCVREEKLTNVVQQTHKLKNLPWLLRYPVVDKLEHLKTGLPVLILLAGPSLADIAPDLSSLARKCLVVCVSRTINFCLKNGVAPDFVIQLDTYQRSRHFYPHQSNLMNTYLISHVLSPSHIFANKFRGLFFFESFDQNILTNSFRLKRSYLSSLFGCLGLAETLQASDVFMAGADLSLPINGHPYYYNYKNSSYINSAKFTNNSLPDTPVLIRIGNFNAPDINGNLTQTNMNYFTAGYEAEHFAQEISQKTRIRFFNLTRKGILSPQVFAPAHNDLIMNQKDINRSDLLIKIDQAIKKKENINYGLLIKRTAQLVTYLNYDLTFLQTCNDNHKLDLAYENPYFKSLKYLNDYKTLYGDTISDKIKLELVINLVNEWKKSAQTGKNLAQLYLSQTTGQPVPLVCMANERKAILSRSKIIFPEWNWSVCLIWEPSLPKPKDEDNVELINFNKAGEWLKNQKIVIISSEIIKAYDYLFKTSPFNNVLSLKEIKFFDLQPKNITDMNSSAIDKMNYPDHSEKFSCLTTNIKQNKSGIKEPSYTLPDPTAINQLGVQFPLNNKISDSAGKKFLFYFFKNVHIPILIPIYKKLKHLHPEAQVAFGYMQYSPHIRAGFTQSELKILETYGEKMYSVPQEFRPDVTFIADSVYPWTQDCGKLVNVGHGVLSKGQYYTDTETARRENMADLVCVPGAYHENIMNQMLSTPVTATGMAKLDGIFNGSINETTVKKQFGLPGNNYRYILFAPTFNDELSAIPCVLDRITEVIPDDRTLMLVKLHGSSSEKYKDMYRNLVQKDQRIIFTDELDITPFLSLAHLMISDVSSAMMEFAALDKPLVLFNNPNWSSYQNYNPDDIEFRWRDIGIQVTDLKEMKEAVKQSFARPDEFSKKRKHYTDQLFANKYDGKATERIVEKAFAL